MESDVAPPPVLSWRNLREYGEQRIELTFEGKLRLEVPNDILRTPAGRRRILSEFELQIGTFATRLAHAFLSSRDQIQERANIPDFVEQILPWLTVRAETPQAVGLSVRQLVNRFDVAEPLAGQLVADTLTIASFSVYADADWGLEPIEVLIENVKLGEGSVWAGIKVKVKVTAFTLTLAFAAISSPIIADEIERYKDQKGDQQHIEFVIANEICTLEKKWKADGKQLRQLTAEALNYAEPGLTKEQESIRVCNVQLMLKMVQGSPGDIDGIVGPKTRAALAYFAESHDLPNDDIKDEVFRGRLLEAFENELHEI